MADLKISQLTSATTPLAGTETAPIVQSGVTKKVTVEDIAKSTQPSGTAKGVMYLNNSKVPTTGSGLLFDGVNFLVGTPNTDAFAGIAVLPNSSQGAAQIYFNRANTASLSYPIVFFNNSSSVGNINFDNTTTTYATSSDYRLKENIQPMVGALAKVAALKPCTYNWKIDGSDGQGFIAHELAEVVPRCVTGEKDAVDDEGRPVYQGIDTSFLVATLTAAIQEQQAIINQLKARLDAAKL